MLNPYKTFVRCLFLCQHSAMPDTARIPIEELRALEAQVVAQPVDDSGILPFLKDGILAVIQAAIAAEVELARRGG
jgi:hypothetical protein